MVDFGAIAAYEPKWPGVKELNLADQWRARWVDEQTLAVNAPVSEIYAMVVMGDKGYATRAAGASKWGMVEAPIAGEPLDDALKKALNEQAGATAAVTQLVGFYECRATMHNPEFKAGEVTVRPLYIVAAKQVDDLPAGSAFERRRFPLNEYMVAMRARYPEFIDHLGPAIDRYAVMKAKGLA